MTVIKKSLEFKNMKIIFDYQTKEMMIEHMTGTITLDPSDVSDLRDALSAVGRQPEGTQSRRS